MKKVRFGVVGVAGMGGRHARDMVEAKSRDFYLAAICDVVESTAEKVAKELDVPYFTDAEAMYDSGLIDAVIIATPHYFHPALAAAATKRKLHVLSEKPLAVTVGEARKMITNCKKHKVALGAMLQQRTRGAYMKMKQIVDSGRLGDIYRVEMTCSNWYRTQAYYDSGAWRGTWGGEGGGLLLNQMPHSLDLFQWIGGMPKVVVADLETRLHKIAVENTASLLFKYDGPKSGYIYASTAHLPGDEKFLICGDKGSLMLEKGKLYMAKLSVPLSKHIFACKEHLADHISGPNAGWKEVKVDNSAKGSHVGVIAAFARHLLRGTPMVATGEEAINELEMSNAAYLSGFNGMVPVSIPVNAAAMDRLLAKLVREEKNQTAKKSRKKSKKSKKK